MKVNLTCGNLRLRRWSMSDAEALVKALHESVKEMNRFLPWCTPEYSLEDATTWIGNQAHAWDVGESYTFCIEDMDTGRILGCCGLDDVDHNHRLAEMGYWVRTSAAGAGVGTKAATMVCRFGLDQLDLVRIEIIVCVLNRASIRVATRIGAKREGRHRNRLIIHGKMLDAYIYSIIPGDLKLPPECL